MYNDNSFHENRTGSGGSGGKKESKSFGTVKPKQKAATAADLFGIDDMEDGEFEYRAGGSGGGAGKVKIHIVERKPMSSRDNNSEDDDDDLGFDPKQPKAGNKLRSFDDMLGKNKGPPLTEAVVLSDELIQNSNPLIIAAGNMPRPTVSRQSTETTTTDNSNRHAMQGLQAERPKTSSRGRRNTKSSANPDPLGLGREDDSNKLPTAKEPFLTTGKANWLGLTQDSNGKSASQLQVPVRQPEVNQALPVEDDEPTVEVPRIDIHIGNIEGADHLRMDNASENAAPPANNHRVENQGVAPNMTTLNALSMQQTNATIGVLQQQQSQLKLAAQMKGQEEALLEMRKKQDELLKYQERTFSTLLQDQIHRQYEMEQHIIQQQQRINAHIQLMMTQQPHPLPTTHMGAMNMPMSVSAPNATASNSNADDGQPLMDQRDAAMQDMQIEIDLKRYQLENAQLETMVQSLKTNYENEIEVIERSYKKRLQVLEDHHAAVESRLKTEMGAQAESYEQRLQRLQNEMDKLKMAYEEDWTQLKQAHEEELRKLKRSHEGDFDMLKEEHKRMLETVRQAKLLEFAAVQDNVSYLDTLRSASNNLQDVSGNLQSLRDELGTKMETLNRERESKLKARERRVEDEERRLEITSKAAEEEKCRLMELISNLELQLGQITKESADENWLLRQKLTTLDTEKAAFEREKEFTRSQLEREEQRLAALKEQMMQEEKRMRGELQKDRTQFQQKVTEFETKQKLNGISNGNRVKVETALKVAQDAARQANEKRQRLHRAHRQLEQERRDLIDRNNALRVKEDELEQEFCSLNLAERKTQEALKQAKQTEMNYQQKLQMLQKRMQSLVEKEESLSQQHMLITQERIQLHNQRAKLIERKCVLCQMNERNEEISQLLAIESQNPAMPMMSANIQSSVNLMPTDNCSSVYRLEHPTNVVERMLDENINDSYRRMRRRTNTTPLNEMVSDSDDFKPIHPISVETNIPGEPQTNQRPPKRNKLNHTNCTFIS